MLSTTAETAGLTTDAVRAARSCASAYGDHATVRMCDRVLDICDDEDVIAIVVGEVAGLEFDLAHAWAPLAAGSEWSEFLTHDLAHGHRALRRDHIAAAVDRASRAMHRASLKCDGNC